MTVLTIETLEQKWIQIQGFFKLLAVLFHTCPSLHSLAVDISDDGIVGNTSLLENSNTLSHAAFIVNFMLLRVFIIYDDQELSLSVIGLLIYILNQLSNICKPFGHLSYHS